MSRFSTHVAVMLGLAAATTSLRAQEWNDARTRALVERATQRRAQQLADTALADYRASAHGYVTFLGQLGEEAFTEPPRIVKADELAVEVYWKAPNLSKQRIVGTRDTLLAPTDIVYHRDHLGIVQNNFPSIIRLGDGDEVRDVPHPLSAIGLAQYDFAIRDSLQIRLPDRTLDVYEVRVRPRDDRQPRVIGAVYLDRETGEVVRMAFNFTRAAYLDRQLEDLAVVLENALVDGRFWLPRRQEIEIRRTTTWLDYPARGIIRGRWEICCYEINTGIPATFFRGPEIVLAPREQRERYAWEGQVLDSLPPDIRAVTDADVRRVQAEARELVRAQALARSSGAVLSARRVSDFVRVNRVEGLALGAGARVRFGAGTSLTVNGRWGLEDEEGKARVALDLERASGVGIRLFAEREYRDAGDMMETSLLRNSLAAQEYGSDYTEPYDVSAVGATVSLGGRFGVCWSAGVAYEAQEALAVNATPARGRYEPTIPAWSLNVRSFTLGAERPTSLFLLGTELRLAAELRTGWFSGSDTTIGAASPRFVRGVLSARVERPVGRHRLVSHTVLAAVDATPAVPPQEMVFFGGPTSGPGYGFHEFVGELGLSQRLEWRVPVPFPPIPLGRFGQVPGTATLAPFAHVVYIDDYASFAPARQGWYPALGVSAFFLFDLLRLDVARGLRDGRWTFSIDVARELWGIL
ncbi:MAG: hypothetical protein ACREON_01185 [Gemmatimonadaceae bacterium]